MTDHVTISHDGRLARLTLDRPRALNALSLEMIRAITAALTAWRDDQAMGAVVIDSSMGRAFCAGGDIRYFHEMATATPAGGSAGLEDFFSEEYALNHMIHHYPKPYIALMDGVVMGGGMGISQGGRMACLRIVTERTKMAMPEVNIGLFPDVGGSFFLTRARGKVGWYLALTGHVIGGADAVYAGLADALVPFEKHPQLLTALASACDDAASSMACLDRIRHEAIAPLASLSAGDKANADAPLASHQETIDRHFAHAGIAHIMASLASDSGPFAQEALASMQKRSPLMLGVALEQLRRGADLAVGDCLRMERSMVRRCFERGEVAEGIRAAVIDKDHAPRWNPASFDEVSDDMIAAFFMPAWPPSAHPLRHLKD